MLRFGIDMYKLHKQQLSRYPAIPLFRYPGILVPLYYYN